MDGSIGVVSIFSKIGAGVADWYGITSALIETTVAVDVKVGVHPTITNTPMQIAWNLLDEELNTAGLYLWVL